MSSRLGPRTTRRRWRGGSDGDVAVARQQRRHDAEQGLEPGGEVDVRVGDHVRRARQPDHASGHGRAP